MLKLTTYSGNFGEPSNSPFCMKAICLLQMSGLDWEPDFTADPRKAPKSKLPVLVDGATITPDSDQIRDYLETEYAIDFDKGLSAEEKAVSRAFIRMAEEHLYFLIVCDRWMDDANWVHVRDAYFSEIPALLRGFITGRIRKQAIASVKGQGVGRHTVEERFERGRKDINAIADFLGDKKFLFGDKPTAADATIGPALRCFITTPEPTPLNTLVRENAGLMAYTERVREALYPKF